jgi:uncharacterized protein YcbK (DUF882 family)
MRVVAPAVGFALLALSVSLASPANAEFTHIVQRGHTLESIAHRYRVTEKAIIDANHLADPKHLKPGQTLVIPGVDGPKKKHAAIDKHEGETRPTEARAVRAVTAEVESPPEPRGHSESDSIHAVRLGEDFHIRVRDTRGHVPPSALKAFERMMRQGNAAHPIDPRLVSLLGIVSNHFGGKTIDVVSGYRAYTPTQYTPHSNHNYGKAVDFRVRGVSDEALRDFCRTLRSAGCGYYPNGSFVHLDVRETKAYWTDWSRPGEPPKYDRSGTGADEGTSDVPQATGDRVDEHESMETQWPATGSPPVN